MTEKTPLILETGILNKKLVKWISVLFVFLFTISISCCSKKTSERMTMDFNRDWFFKKGEQTENVTLLDFGDSEWEPVRLPHDWAIAGPFDPVGDGSTGKLPWKGVGWYRKRFSLDADYAGRRVYFDFDGVMAFPRVYINGHIAGEWDYGYNSFRVDATPHVQFGETNLIVVKADTQKHRSRWYPGAGIYRKVTMTVTEPVHIAHWGTFITTPSVSHDSATVSIKVTVENHLDKDVSADVAIILTDPDGLQTAKGDVAISVSSKGTADAVQKLEISNPRKWDIDHPELYKANIVVSANGQKVDSETITFGIRTFKFTANDGFYLNGRRVQLCGVNLHHDQGVIGAAFNTRAMERQLEIMQEMGVNALRTSHNPPAPEVLDLCDRMGIVVWDEAFDKWEGTADHLTDESMKTFGERQLRNFVMRDRNHPSVVLWSIGNEIWTGEENWGKTAERVSFMRDFVLKYDPTRPVTIGNDKVEDGDNDVLDSLDAVGYNYMRRYGRFRETHPGVPLIYSESASTVSTRGYYDFPLPEIKTQFNQEAGQVSSYDFNAMWWSDVADRDFFLMEEDSFVAGEFVWTGFDYLGEPSPFMNKARSSYFGIVDLCGIPKDRYYLYRSYWRPDEFTAHILPHWNWANRKGKTVPVFVYTNGDSAELFLNGRSLGKRTKLNDVPGGLKGEYYAVIDKYRLRWLDVVYEPGELKAVIYKDGAVIGEVIKKTAGMPVKLTLAPDRNTISADGNDLSYILVEAVDNEGNLCPLVGDRVTFKLDGPSEIMGIGNGNPLSMEPFKDSVHSLFYGKAMLVIRSIEGESGPVTISATAEGYEITQVHLQAISKKSFGPISLNNGLKR
jgi:beta-galactosidase